MTWKPIVAGVDTSAAGTTAALVALELARTAKTECHLVYAVPDPMMEPPFTEPWAERVKLARTALESARTLMQQMLKDRLPPSALERLAVRAGPAAKALSQAAEEYDADLVVVGGKHHSAVGRLLAGSTAQEMVRTLKRPLLVTGPEAGNLPEKPYTRVIAAIDLTPASQATVDTAGRVARLFGATLRVLHVVEPVPRLPGMATGLDDLLEQRSEAEFQISAWPHGSFPQVDLVRRGPAATTIAEAVSDWGADLLVLGPHDRGWVERVLVGSVTESLLRQLPTSVLVVPASGVAAGASDQAASPEPTAAAPPSGD